MANEELIDALKSGWEGYSEWRKANPSVDLQLHEVSLQNLSLKHVDISHVSVIDSSLRNSVFLNTVFTESSFKDSNLSGVDFKGCDLSHSNFVNCDLRHADFSKTVLKDTVFSSCRIDDAKFHEASIVRTSFADTQGISRTHGLESTHISDPTVDAKDFDKILLPWTERWCDWEVLRTMGRLPLFGLSYSVLILIPFTMYLLAVWNDLIEVVRRWAAKALETQVGQIDVIHRLAEVILDHLRPQPIPSQSLLLLSSTLLLAIASTIYTLSCPSRIKEFTKDVWCDQLGRSLVHYWPFAWRYRTLRLVCGSCYVLGGLGALYVIIVKVIKAGLYIWRHSSFQLF